MKTDDLIGLLAADAAPPAPLRPWRIGAVVIGGIVVIVGLFLLLAGTRPGLGEVILRPEVAAKTLIPLASFLLCLPLALASLRPDGARQGLHRLLLPALVALALWLWAFAILPPPMRFADVSTFALSECLGLITGLSILPLVLFLGLMRRGATLAPARTGALAGLATGCGVAAGYSLFCTQDNPIFFVTWYGVAILIVTLTGAVIGARQLRW